MLLLKSEVEQYGVESWREEMKQMKVFVVYAHPSEKSFTYRVRERFISGLEEAGHSYEISDLYEMNFKTDLTEEEYLREGFYRKDLPVPEDVKIEQEK